ncbi:MAG: deacetylase [Ruminococcaceae bacterium]|nr:deacetylase [Oscillospiraceae bacterium]
MRKKYHFRGGVLVLALALLMTLAAPVSAANKRDLPIYAVGRDDHVVSLSFDAAWGNEDTEELIAILGKYGIRATFFVVGEWVDKYPESVKALHDAGHEIMNHSDTHPHFTALSPEEMTAEVKACSDKIEAITGVRPELFRPPYGDYNDAVVSTLRREGYYTIQWDVDSLDWKNPGSDAIVKRVLEKTVSGSILLFHNAAEQTPAALPAIIEGLQAKGFSFAPISELIYRENFEIDHAGVQQKTT